MNKAVFKVTKINLDRLEDHELASMFMTLNLYPNSDFRQMPYYSRVAPLFQQEYDPPIMHDETKEAFLAIVATRLEFE